MLRPGFGKTPSRERWPCYLQSGLMRPGWSRPSFKGTSFIFIVLLSGCAIRGRASIGTPLSVLIDLCLLVHIDELPIIAATQCRHYISCLKPAFVSWVSARIGLCRCCFSCVGVWDLSAQKNKFIKKNPAALSIYLIIGTAHKIPSTLNDPGLTINTFF